MVCRFVQKQHVWCVEQELTQRNAAFFTTRQGGYVCIVRGAAQRLHGHVDLRVEVPKVLGVDLILKLGHFVSGFIGIVHREFVVAIKDVFFRLHTKHDIFTHAQVCVQFGFLREVADSRALGRPCFALKFFVLTGHNAHQGRFTCAVDTDNADFHTGQEVQADVFKDFFTTGVGFGHTIHKVDILVSGHGSHPFGIKN